MKREERNCKTYLQTRSDPYLGAWLARIPNTKKERAIWEFIRNEKKYIPYKWKGLNLNPKIPEGVFTEVFSKLENKMPDPPRRDTKTLFTFALISALVTIIVISLALFVVEDETLKAILIVLAVAVAIAFLGYNVTTYCKYKSQLNAQQKTVQGVLDKLNSSLLAQYSVKMKAGIFGAWVEANFLKGDVCMVGGMGSAGTGKKLALL